MKKRLLIISILVMVMVLPTSTTATANSKEPASLSPIEELGKAIFFDTSLSSNGTMSCASCHATQTGFTGPDSNVNAAGSVYAGAIHTRSGNRNHRQQLMEAIVQYFIMMKPKDCGSVECSGTAELRVGPLVTRWQNRPKALS